MDKDRNTGKHLKERAIEELKLFLVIALYLWVFLGSFTVYRWLIAAEVGTPYLNYGLALIESLIIAKVILIGRIFGVSRHYEDRPLIVPVIYKSLLFGGLVLLFGIVEHLVEGWFHREGLVGGLHTFSELGAYELGARVLTLIVALVPFFAFGELARVLGADRLKALFFSRRTAEAEARRSAA